MATAPERIAWAVDVLDVEPDDRILELGFGPGVSLSLIASRLGAGQVTGIDRSATAVARASARLAGEITAGRVAVEHVDLAGFSGTDADGSFDKALGVNVNCFWTGDAEAELSVLARILRPGGTLFLAYEGPPGGAVRSDVVPLVTANLERHGFAVSTIPGPSPQLVGISGSLRN
jgi:SAM-dependent methyltransferase